MKNKSIKINIIGLRYSLNFYMQIHKKVLNRFFFTEENPIEDIIPNYDRRSLFTLPIDLIYIFKWLIRNEPIYIISVGPKVGFLFAIASFFTRHKLIHWYTGQKWALIKNKFLSPSYLADFTVNLLAYKTLCDSKEQAYFLKNNFFKKQILFDDLGSINYVSKDLLSIGRERTKKINSPNFKYEYPIKVGFLGRICLDKGLIIIKKLSEDDSLKKKFKFFVRGPGDNSIAKSKNSLEKKFEFKNSSNFDFKEGFMNNEDFFKSIDIFLLPSEREGFGSVALEAQACGIPVVCSNIYGLYSSVIEGVGGIHCKSFNDYRNALNNLLNLKFYTIISNKAYKFSLNYTEEKFSNNLYKLYKNIIL